MGILAARIRSDAARLGILLQEARKAEIYPLELEVRLALGQIDKSGLAALQKEATVKGFGLIARKAAEPSAGRTRL